MDLVLGDVAFPNLNLMINGGTGVNENSAMVSTDPFFPSNSIPASMQLFPAAFNLDVDFQSIKDLILAPNAKTIFYSNFPFLRFIKETVANMTSIEIANCFSSTIETIRIAAAHMIELEINIFLLIFCRHLYLFHRH